MKLISSRYLFKFFLSVLLLSFQGAGTARAIDLSEASRGLPQVAEDLTPDTFVEVKTKRLAQAQVLWVNFELLQELGIDVPAEGYTPEFEKKLLDAFAFVVPRKNDSPDEFLETEKTFYADRYGGDGMGYAQGSGRAAGAGLFQIKGIGRTSLVGHTDFDPRPKRKFYDIPGIMQNIWDNFVDDNHSHGGATLSEAMAEAVWGEILHKEMPYGANRVAVIIGTRQAIGMMKNPRALIVRENSLRPAHYMINLQRPESETKIEMDRVRELMTPFSNLPFEIPNRSKALGPRIRQVVGVIVDRVARKYGTEYAHSLFHGSTSPSNIEVTGKALDHGPMTALDGFPQAMNVDYHPNGDFTVFLESIIDQLVTDLKKTVCPEDRDFIPTKSDVKEIMKVAYNEQIQVEILWRAGLPPDLAKAIQKTAAGQKMAEVLLAVGQAGNTEIISTKKKVPRKSGTYDFNQVMLRLSQPGMSTSEVSDWMIKEISDPRLATEVVQAWGKYQATLRRYAFQKDFAFSHLEHYIELAAKQRNRTFYDLMRSGTMFARQFIHMAIWTMTRLAPSISSYVDGMVQKHTRNFETFSPMDLVIEEQMDLRTGSVVRKVYEGQTGIEKFQIVAFAKDGQLQFNKSSLRVSELAQGGFVSLSNGQQVGILKVIQDKNRTIIDLESRDFSLKSFQRLSQKTPAQSSSLRPVASGFAEQCSAVF